MSSDEKRPRSWKEIDQARIRGIKVEKKISKGEQREQKLASKQALKELDSLFSTSKLSKEKAVAIEEIKSMRGKLEFSKRMDEYVEKFGLPLDWDTQMLFLDHRKPQFVIQILDQLIKSAPTENLARQETLNQRLRVLQVSSFDGDLSRKIEELQKALLKF